MKLKIFISVFISILILVFSLLPVSAETASEDGTTCRVYFYNYYNGESLGRAYIEHPCTNEIIALRELPDFENVYYCDLDYYDDLYFTPYHIDVYKYKKDFQIRNIFTPNSIIILNEPPSQFVSPSFHLENIDSFKTKLTLSQSASSLSNNIFSILGILIPVCILIFAVIIGIKSAVRFIRGLIAK